MTIRCAPKTTASEASSATDNTTARSGLLASGGALVADVLAVGDVIRVQYLGKQTPEVPEGEEPPAEPPEPVDVWRLGVGMAALAGLFREVTDAEAEVVLDHAWNEGIRYYDTAPLYGYGVGEERLGRLLTRHDHREFAISSKVGRLIYPIETIDSDPTLEPDRPAVDIPGFDPREGYFKGAPPQRPVFDYSYDGVMRSVEDSLRRTGLERIDIFWIHDPDMHWAQAIEGAYPALAELRSTGVVSAIGVGMNQAEMLTRFVREAELDAVMCAGRYTLLSIAGVILGGGEFVGGRVSPIGAVIGAMTLTLAVSFLTFLRIAPDWQIGAQGAILIIVLALRAIIVRSEKRR